jgi:predicted SAM-dependent methyltransferase
VALENAIAELSARGSRLRLLEVSGFGYVKLGGRHVQNMAEERVDITCADFYQQNFRAMERVDLTDLQFADASFDIIGHSHFLEHIEDDERAISECYRCLSRGGILVMSVPIQTDFTFPVSGEYHGDNAIVYR